MLSSVDKWSVEKVCSNLEQLQIEKYIPLIKQFKINGLKLLLCSKKYFHNELKMSIKDRKLLSKMIDSRKLNERNRLTVSRVDPLEGIINLTAKYDSEEDFKKQKMKAPEPILIDKPFFTNIEFYDLELGLDQSSDVDENFFIEYPEKFKLVYAHKFLNKEHKFYAVSQGEETIFLVVGKLESGEGFFYFYFLFIFHLFQFFIHYFIALFFIFYFLFR